MKIEFVPSFDLFQNGNYVASFPSAEKVEEYFIKKYFDDTSYRKEDDVLKEYNTLRYHVVESSRLQFKNS